VQIVSVKAWSGYSSTCKRCQETQQQEEKKNPEGITNYSYTGETARTLFTRAKQHLNCYRSHLPGHKPSESWMWENTTSHHGGLMGPNEGEKEYQFRVQNKNNAVQVPKLN
jgi:hypothetical protein